MSIKNRNIDIIDHILNYCYQIDETRQRFGNNFDNFQADKIYQNAVCMCILQIGELSKYLTDDFKNLYSEIPWNRSGVSVTSLPMIMAALTSLLFGIQ